MHSLLGTLLTPANPRNLQCEHNRHSDTINITVLTPKRPPKQGKKYAVAYGRRPGVYNTWQEAEQQVKGYPKSVLHRGCKELQQVELIIRSKRYSQKVQDRGRSLSVDW